MKTSKRAEPIPIKIRPARLKDTKLLADVFETAVKLHFDYFSPEYAARVLRENNAPRIGLSIIRPNRLVFLAEADGDIRGYAFGSLPADGRAQLYWLYVEPGTRGQNIGLSLLSKMLQAVRAKGASELQLVTYRYAPYYARQGFVQTNKVHLGGVEQDVMRFKFK